MNATAWAGPYFRINYWLSPQHEVLYEYFDTNAEAWARAVSVAASFGHDQGYVLTFGSGALGGHGGNWYCKLGPNNCNYVNAQFQLYTAYYCSLGQRYAPALERCVPVIDIDRRHKMEDCNAARGNPIYPLTGVKKESVDTGLTIGALPLVLTYSSANQLPMESGTEGFEPVSAPDARAQGLGPVWTTTLHRKLVRGADGVVVGRGDGSTTSFIGTLPADADVADQLDLTTSPMRYVDVNRNALELYDSNENGRLKGIEWASGERIEATYSSAATPLTVAPAPGYLVRQSRNHHRADHRFEVSHRVAHGRSFNPVGNHLDAPLKLSTQIELRLEHQPRPFSALLLDECFDLCMLGSKQLVAPQLLFNTVPKCARSREWWLVIVNRLGIRCAHRRAPWRRVVGRTSTVPAKMSLRPPFSLSTHQNHATSRRRRRSAPKSLGKTRLHAGFSTSCRTCRRR